VCADVERSRTGMTFCNADCILIYLSCDRYYAHRAKVTTWLCPDDPPNVTPLPPDYTFINGFSKAIDSMIADFNSSYPVCYNI